MALRHGGTYPGDYAGVDPSSADPLLKYPRMIHMHHWDRTSLEWMLDPRLGQILAELDGVEPFGVQTMLYFKPAGARGQALHQDQWYLKVQPGTCMAAWLALDPCDEENGCMMVVRGSHQVPVLCTQAADVSQSFTDVTCPIPPGMSAEPVVMGVGDVLFFHGNLIHGSYPNRSADRFRRALIGHYVSGSGEKVAQFYSPIYRFDGTTLELEINSGGGPCGVFKTEGGETVLEMVAPTGPKPAEHE